MNVPVALPRAARRRTHLLLRLNDGRKDYAHLFQTFYYFLEDSSDEPRIVVFDELEKTKSASTGRSDAPVLHRHGGRTGKGDADLPNRSSSTVEPTTGVREIGKYSWRTLFRWCLQAARACTNLLGTGTPAGSAARSGTQHSRRIDRGADTAIWTTTRTSVVAANLVTLRTCARGQDAGQTPPSGQEKGNEAPKRHKASDSDVALSDARFAQPAARARVAHPERTLPTRCSRG